MAHGVSRLNSGISSLNDTHSPTIGRHMIDRNNDRSHVAWDIETTGFDWNDEITVLGFWFPAGHATLAMNASQNTADPARFEQRLEDISGTVSLQVYLCPSEVELLNLMQEVVFEQIDTEYNRLVAFNADSWQGGFDLPFVRTRCFAHDYPWIFDGIEFADLWEPVKKRLNTTVSSYGGSTEVNSLTGSHELLFNNPTTISPPDLPDDYQPYRENPYDPFTDSGSAVYCYRNGEYLPVLRHNLADIHRTWELGELVRQYVPSKDITTKKL